MSDLTIGTAHKICMDAGVHVCQKPSPQRCHTQPCENQAGTLWGPYWCPEHDKERLDRITGQMDEIMSQFGSGGIS